MYLQLQCLEPLHLGTRHPYGLFRLGEAVLRGGRVLAALAQLHGGLLFGGGNNIVVEDAPVIASVVPEDTVVYLPLTAETCKAFPGDVFEPDSIARKGEDLPHRVWDTLLPRWFFTRRPVLSPPASLWGRCLWPGCYGSTKPFSRFVQRRSIKSTNPPRYRYQESNPTVERRAHTALNPTRGTAEYGLLFADELVIPGTRFYLCIRLQAETSQELQQRVQHIGDLVQKQFCLGGAKSRGHGLVRGFDFGIPSPELPANRLERFDKLTKDLARTSKDDSFESSRTYFSLTLQSPLLLPDQDVQPDWDVWESDRGVWTGRFPSVATLPGIRLEFLQHRFTQVSGWSSLWQLPKPALRALAAGSVYIFSTTVPTDAVRPIAEELEFSGAGLFRAEGFGSVNVSDPFHREVQSYGDTAA
jgi:CRISPR-associated Csx10 family RAMP protein